LARLIAWMIVIGDVDAINNAATEMGKCVELFARKKLRNATDNSKVTYMLEHIDIIREHIKRNVILKDLIRGDQKTVSDSMMFTLLSDAESVTQSVYEATMALLSDGRGTCRMCMKHKKLHESISITADCERNELVSFVCKVHEIKSDEFIQDAHYTNDKKIRTKILKLPNRKREKRLVKLLSELRNGKINDYVTKENTCYASGQRGKLILPVIMDSFILRMCGIDTYVTSSGELMMIDEWSIDDTTTIERPLSLKSAEFCSNRPLHLTSNDTTSVQVLRNVGRLMIAGCTTDRG
jgi:hypothetical protein